MSRTVPKFILGREIRYEYFYFWSSFEIPMFEVYRGEPRNMSHQSIISLILIANCFTLITFYHTSRIFRAFPSASDFMTCTKLLPLFFFSFFFIYRNYLIILKNVAEFIEGLKQNRKLPDNPTDDFKVRIRILDVNIL